MKSIQSLYRILVLAHRAHPGRITLQVFERCLSLAYGSVYTLLFFRRIINSFEKSTSFSGILWFLLCFLLLGLGVGLFKAWFCNTYRPSSDQIVVAYITERVRKKALESDIADYETPAFYDNYTRAMEQAAKKTLTLLENFAGFLGVIFALILNTGFVVLVDPLLLLLAVFPIVASFFFRHRRSIHANWLENENVSPNRQADYVHRVSYLPDYAKELRMTKIRFVLQDTFHKAMKQLHHNLRVHGKWIAFYRFLADFVLQGFLYLSLYACIVWRYLVENAFLLGDFASLSGAVMNLIVFAEDLSSYYGTLHQLSLYAENLQTFLDSKPFIRSGNRRFSFTKEIVFECVTFTYPGHNQPALKEVSFTIHAGEHAAIVGYNGAGKSTLVKLLLRLYDVDSGEIWIDGHPISEYQLKSLRAGFACVFQDFQIYAATVAENILMRPVRGKDEPDVCMALKRVELSIENSMETVLTHEFDENGLLLSGGQAQKLAMSRILLSPASIVIMDEPSAALDPISETALIESMMAACAERTVLSISHRLSSVKNASHILMFGQGRLLEEGSHAELLRREGTYAQMWCAQAERYQKGENTL